MIFNLARRPWYQNPLRYNGENDFWLGPVTISKSSYSNFGLIFSSFGGGEDDDRPASVQLSIARLVLIVRLPRWLVPGPTITRTYPDDPAWKAPDGEVYKRLGRDYYETADAHEYGFSIINAGTVGGGQFLLVKLGRSTNDSSTDRSWSKFLPWTTWRHVRITFFDLECRPVGSIYDKDHPRGAALGVPGKYDVQREMEARVPKARFTFTDFDGEALVATTHVEEREWRAGEGWFKWLSWFRKPIIQRSLSIDFSGETGKRKGSWKGGTTGTSIDMRPDDTHLQAFIRYCNEHDMKWVGWAEGEKAVDTSASRASHYS